MLKNHQKFLGLALDQIHQARACLDLGGNPT